MNNGITFSVTLWAGEEEKTHIWELGCAVRQRELTGQCRLPHNSKQEKVSVEGIW